MRYLTYFKRKIVYLNILSLSWDHREIKTIYEILFLQKYFSIIFLKHFFKTTWNLLLKWFKQISKATHLYLLRLTEPLLSQLKYKLTNITVSSYNSSCIQNQTQAMSTSTFMCLLKYLFSPIHNKLIWPFFNYS